MRPIRLLTVLLAATVPAFAAAQDAPTLFAPGVISGPGDEGAAAFTPDGATVYFAGGTGDRSVLLESHHSSNGWSTPRYVNPTDGSNRELIMRGVGLSGTEQIFIGFRSYHSVASDYYNLSVAAFTGSTIGVTSGEGRSRRSTRCT